jgi:hypothetical protein
MFCSAPCLQLGQTVDNTGYEGPQLTCCKPEMLQEPGKQDAESSATSLASVSIGAENSVASLFIIITIKKPMQIKAANHATKRAIDHFEFVMK